MVEGAGHGADAQRGCRLSVLPWFVFQKLQRQHVAQQQQLEEQIQLLQQQQEMLLSGRVSREGIPEEPGELELSQGSASELSQSSSPSACLKDPANGTVSPEPAVPGAAEGGCRGNGQAVGASVQRYQHPEQVQGCLQMRGLHPTWDGRRCQICSWISMGYIRVGPKKWPDE